jgi:hypothetical protein
MAPQANGKAFLGLIKFIKQNHGDNAIEPVIAAANHETQTIFSNRILMNDWYPYGAFVGFLEAMQATHGQGDPSYLRRAGESAGQRDLGTIYKIYKVFASSEKLIRSCDSVWASYYRGAGAMQAVTWEPQETVLRITDFPGMSPLHCQLMVGWMTATMREIGITFDEFSERQCQSRGAPYHEFFARWHK